MFGPAGQRLTVAAAGTAVVEASQNPDRYFHCLDVALAYLVSARPSVWLFGFACLDFVV